MNDRSKAWLDEEQHKEGIYRSFERRQQKSSEAVQAAEEYYESGQYEDQDAFMAAGPLSSARRSRRKLEMEIKALYDRPYFAHVQITEKDGGDSDHFYLSDSEWLDSEIEVSEDGSASIIPFKRMTDRPLLEKVRLLYTMPSRNDISVTVPDRRRGTQYTSIFTPNLIRNVDVFRRELRSVDTLLPEMLGDEEEEHIEADELLAQRLQENRADARLRNIISTLQRRQFSIIQSDPDLNFIVQGCAGSGKTQCLIHRLFFLREFLSENGWEKVLLITPTQLFRNYSSDLMRRYRLTDVTNCSLADFYCQLLQSYDPRFRNRQYQFELTEEYLPDKYLRLVYAPEQIAAIETEIHNAIHRHVEEGCALAEIEYNDGHPITIDFVNQVAQRLADAIQRFDDTERAFADDPEYQEHRNAINELDRQIKALHRRQSELLEVRSRLASSKELYDQLTADLAKAKAEEEEWERIVENGEKESLSEMMVQAEAASAAAYGYDLSLSARRYAQALYHFLDMTVPVGERAKYNQAYRELLHGITEECQAALNAFLRKQTPVAWLRNYEQRLQSNQKNLDDVATDIELNQLYLEDHTTWLQEHNVEDAQKQRQVHRAALEHARYYLSRIESSVFEQEVWNALAPLKREYDIETLHVEQLDDGHLRQTRILYKADLLFYLKIYAALHTTKSLRNYGMICVDEGQDMHAADYQLIREIYPQAILNIFGDTEQVLHESCGISDWRRDTDIDTVYTMNDNYRNTPAIVDFCNAEFGSEMRYCGTIREDQRPKIIDNTAQLLDAISQGISTIVLRDKESFELLCELTGSLSSNFEYIDTKCDSVPAGKVACYSIYAAKGLEFSKVLVFAEGMTKNQRIVACTRAMDELFYFE